jgi:hypothetical protein
MGICVHVCVVDAAIQQGYAIKLGAGEQGSVSVLPNLAPVCATAVRVGGKVGHVVGGSTHAAMETLTSESLRSSSPLSHVAYPLPHPLPPTADPLLLCLHGKSLHQAAWSSTALMQSSHNLEHVSPNVLKHGAPMYVVPEGGKLRTSLAGKVVFIHSIMQPSLRGQQLHTAF